MPKEKVSAYESSGLLLAAEVAKLVKNCEWNVSAVEKREAELLHWASNEWKGAAPVPLPFKPQVGMILVASYEPEYGGIYYCKILSVEDDYIDVLCTNADDRPENARLAFRKTRWRDIDLDITIHTVRPATEEECALFYQYSEKNSHDASADKKALDPGLSKAFTPRIGMIVSVTYPGSRKAIAGTFQGEILSIHEGNLMTVHFEYPGGFTEDVKLARKPNGRWRDLSNKTAVAAVTPATKEEEELYYEDVNENKSAQERTTPN